MTLGFAFCYHKGIKINLTNDFDFDNLPSVPDKRNRISKVDSAVGIVISIVFLVVFLFAPQILGFVITDGTKFISVFDVKAIQSVWYLTFIFALCGITRDTVKLIEGRFCKKVMITTVVTDIISGIFTCIWLLGTDIMNPEFVSSLTAIFSNEEVLVNMFSNFQMFILVVILFALALDMITTVVKTLKNS